MEVGQKISFTHKGRAVVGVIEKIAQHNAIILKLDTDYIGKNEEWYAGESKYFFIKNMKEVKNLKH